jgi:hypothetical protein
MLQSIAKSYYTHFIVSEIWGFAHRRVYVAKHHSTKLGAQSPDQAVLKCPKLNHFRRKWNSHCSFFSTHVYVSILVATPASTVSQDVCCGVISTWRPRFFVSRLLTVCISMTINLLTCLYGVFFFFFWGWLVIRSTGFLLRAFCSLHGTDTWDQVSPTYRGVPTTTSSWKDSGWKKGRPGRFVEMQTRKRLRAILCLVS